MSVAKVHFSPIPFPENARLFDYWCSMKTLPSLQLPFPSDFFHGYNEKWDFSTVTKEIPWKSYISSIGRSYLWIQISKNKFYVLSPTDSMLFHVLTRVK